MFRIIVLTILIPIRKCEFISKNDSSVVIRYTGHVEAADNRILVPDVSTTTDKTTTVVEQVTFGRQEDTDAIIFVPNDKEVIRNDEDDYMKHDDVVKVQDVAANRRTIDDIISGKFKEEEAETELPQGDILFISGKNNDNVEKPTRISERERQQHADVVRGDNAEREPPKVRLNCGNLDCNNIKNATCGGKLENKTWKYRLFMNDCYYRKVNCNFKYENNRYTKVSIDKCKNVGAHNSERPSVYNAMAQRPVKPQKLVIQRRSSGRRANNVDLDGSMCLHMCPAACTEDYEPECGVSSTGVRKVFTNHCKLDYHSCQTMTVWRRRPLADCVGSRKADIRENRAFIGWMQRIGVVDSRGKLVMA